MSKKRLLLIMFTLVILPLVVFISIYQRYAVSVIRRKVTEHAGVVAETFWNYDPANIAYLTLAAQANHYDTIVLKDMVGLMHETIEGSPPTPMERWLMRFKLIPLYTFREEIRYRAETIGTVTVVWRCQTIYVISYVTICLIFIAAGVTLYIRLLGTRQELLVNNRQLQQEVVNRRQAETLLKEAHDTLEHRVQDRTRELSETNRLLNREIAERERTAKALQESEQQFRDIAKNIPGMVFQAHIKPDNSMYYSYISPRASELFDFSKTLEYQTRRIDSRIHPEDRANFNASIAEATRTGGDWNYEGRLMLEDGSTKWFHGLASSERIGDEQVANGILLDITQRKQMEQELTRYRTDLEELVDDRTAELIQAKEAAETARQKAENANRSKSQFLANMSHELRTPMNAILGFAQLMQRDAALTGLQHKHLKTIMRSGEHLLQLINDVLDMSRIEAGRIRLNVSCFDLYNLLFNLEEMLRVRAEKKGLQFTIAHTSDVPRYIRSDESKLRQILINLLGNAIKFTEAGRIALEVAEGEGHVRQMSRLNLQFSIKDTGIGIAQEDIESIFKAFGRTQQSERNVEGTGLGLAISQRFIHLMGGEIHAESEPGKGSTFTFDIHAEKASPAEILPEEIPLHPIGLEPGQPTYRILIVEDTEESRLLLTQLIQSVGFEVKEAVNGREAFKLVKSWHPHLIWMDIRMPVMDGSEATKHIRTLGSSGSHPPVIIALTASVFEEERAEILATGCDDFVRKPFKEDEIFTMMAKYLDVKYVYAEGKVENTEHRKPGIDAVLTPEALATLPANVLTELEHAVKSSNMQLISELLQTIRTYKPAVADALTRLADEFQYEAIATFLQRSRKHIDVRNSGQ